MSEPVCSDAFEAIYKLSKKFTDGRPLDRNLEKSDRHTIQQWQKAGLPVHIPTLSEQTSMTLNRALQTLDRLDLTDYPPEDHSDSISKYGELEKQMDAGVLNAIDPTLHPNKFLGYMGQRSAIGNSLHSVREVRDYLDVLTYPYAMKLNGDKADKALAEKHLAIDASPNPEEQEKVLAAIHERITHHLREAEHAAIQKLAHENVGLAEEADVRRDFTAAIEEINHAFGIQPTKPLTLCAGTANTVPERVALPPPSPDLPPR